ncbi:uncharacterized protein LOC143449073 isoform X1 [Clavelina lepadiformis]|uniref:uncharacterized protein LOC143449073 isoform X1 n=1 Tax=Clavelina lepadiformis TaxID=159417 RepID=UPI004042CEE4
MVMISISCRDPLTFHVTIDDGDSAAMACWRSWSSSNLIPRLTRVMVHWHPYNEIYQSRNYRRFTETQKCTNWTLNRVIQMFQAETGSDAEYVFGVEIWKMRILRIRFFNKLKEKHNPKNLELTDGKQSNFWMKQIFHKFKRRQQAPNI